MHVCIQKGQQSKAQHVVDHISEWCKKNLFRLIHTYIHTLLDHSLKGAFRGQWKQKMQMNITWLIKNPNWQEADQLAIYKRGRGVELGSTNRQLQLTQLREDERTHYQLYLLSPPTVVQSYCFWYPITQIRHAKLLGITINSSLTWNDHIKELVTVRKALRSSIFSTTKMCLTNP